MFLGIQILMAGKLNRIKVAPNWPVYSRLISYLHFNEFPQLVCTSTVQRSTTDANCSASWKSSNATQMPMSEMATAPSFCPGETPNLTSK